MKIEEITPPKAPWKSKTNWAALISAVVVFIPPVAEWMRSHQELYSFILASVFISLRSITSGRISIE